MLIAAQNRVEYRRGAITEWYINDQRDLEQGFTFAQRPSGRGELVIALAVEGGPTPLLDSSGSVLLEQNGQAVLRYGGLKASDARGRTLTACMAVHGNEVRLMVEDSSAAYPMTIDPWVQQAKLTASDGAFNDAFGISVALSGDTAIIGADGSANLTGAAYVFVRSGTTWSQQAKLTASDGAVDDFFGWSVALTGDTALLGTFASLAPGKSVPSKHWLSRSPREIPPIQHHEGSMLVRVDGKRNGPSVKRRPHFADHPVGRSK